MVKIRIWALHERHALASRRVAQTTESITHLQPLLGAFASASYNKCLTQLSLLPGLFSLDRNDKRYINSSLTEAVCLLHTKYPLC